MSHETKERICCPEKCRPVFWHAAVVGQWECGGRAAHCDAKPLQNFGANMSLTDICCLLANNASDELGASTPLDTENKHVSLPHQSECKGFLKCKTQWWWRKWWWDVANYTATYCSSVIAICRFRPIIRLPSFQPSTMLRYPSQNGDCSVLRHLLLKFKLYSCNDPIQCTYKVKQLSLAHYKPLL